MSEKIYLTGQAVNIQTSKYDCQNEYNQIPA